MGPLVQFIYFSRLNESAATRVSKCKKGFAFFSSDGAAQFDVDVKKGLRAVFDQYGGEGSGGSMGGLLNLKSHHQLLQVCGLLILARGSAILLKDSLADPRQTENASEILAEFAIDALSAEQAVKVLDQRVDLQ